MCKLPDTPNITQTWGEFMDEFFRRVKTENLIIEVRRTPSAERPFKLWIASENSLYQPSKPKKEVVHENA